MDHMTERDQAGPAALPERIGGLAPLSENLWWSWHPRAEALYRDLDPLLFNGKVRSAFTRLSFTELANVSSGGGMVPTYIISRK